MVEEVSPGTVGGPVSEDAQVARLLQMIAAAGMAIADVSTVTASLDEVFLTLTEKKPAPAGDKTGADKATGAKVPPAKPDAPPKAKPKPKPPADGAQP